MRHGKKNNHLGRTASHRAALLSNLASSLIIYKRIKTTVAKAKALRKYVEPLLTKSKDDSTHSRRTVFAYLQNKESLKELFGSVADKVATRPGGYTRIIKLGTRLGDNAEMCIIELVDFNQTLLDAKEDKGAKSTTRRSRRSKGKGTSAVSEANVVEEVVATESVYDAEQNLDEAAIESNYVNDPAEAEALAIAEVPEVEVVVEEPVAQPAPEEVAVVEEPVTEAPAEEVPSTDQPSEDKPKTSDEDEAHKA